MVERRFFHPRIYRPLSALISLEQQTQEKFFFYLTKGLYFAYNNHRQKKTTFTPLTHLK